MKISRDRLCRRARAGSAALAALFTLLLAGVVAAALAEGGRLALVRARIDRDGLRAWFLAEAGLADTVAALAPGSDFTEALAASSAPPAEEGAPWTYAAGFLDDGDESPDDPERDANGMVWLRISAFGPPPVRRRLEALVARDLDGLFPGAATLAGGVTELTEGFALDGRDFLAESACTMGADGQIRAGLALPEGSALPAIGRPEQIAGRGDLPSIAAVTPPDLTPLGARPEATRRPAGGLPPVLGGPATPAFTVVDGNAIADGTTTGEGVLYVSGRLEVAGTLAFTGVLAAAGGVLVTSTGNLLVCGALWAAGDPALEAHGAGYVRASAGALRAAARVAPLPARARVIATAEIS